MAQPKNKRAAVLLQLTDIHLHAADDARMEGINTHEALLTVLNHAQQDSRWPPDAIVVTGDIVQDESEAAYERFREALQPFGLPVLCIPGNHDDPEIMTEVLTNPPFQLCGDAKLGKWRLIMLSTFQKGEVAGTLGRERLEQLAETLSRDPQEHVLICMHHQPLPVGSAWLDRYGLTDAVDFLNTIDRHDHVRAVLWGHVHQVSDRQRRNVRFLSTPSTCFQFRPETQTCEYDSRPPALRWLALEPNGMLTTEVDWVDTAVKTSPLITSTQ
jgi:Icc protein